MSVEIRLKEIRQSRQLSQNKLARLLEMSLANVQKMEYGKAKAIPFETLDKLCKILECQVGELIVFIPDSEDKPQVSTTSSFFSLEEASSSDKDNTQAKKLTDSSVNVVASQKAVTALLDKDK
ncbi:helix-turn-helix domain-containing protein [Gloeothece verrucosa]|uniref:Transcriptional regulator, XRE family n=1 Tax=Gloeothece verrucosa (strain PCC 7822) TaxID=497965 RepID=E0UNM0_GLOV7|nr:helix-turn-helix transcriptional regulator [Gloeothece verrucosa]ADN18550.1 transcriptional regulator, XRE family [Gloeothece verrucosa PCC 7822]